jgi:serine protease Do
VNYQSPFPIWLDSKNPLIQLVQTPKFFTPTSEFSQSLSAPPTAAHPLTLAWMGAMELAGLKKEEAEYFGLVNQPAVQIGGIAAGGPSEKAGIKQGDIVVKMDGQPLERADDPDDLPLVLRRKLLRMNPGTVVTFSILRGKDQPLKDVRVTLEPRPPQPATAKRYWAQDLGFGVRELVFEDRYIQKLAPDAGGLIVTVIKPDSSAGNGHLQMNDLVTQMNGQSATDLASFKTAYQNFRKSQPAEAVVMVVRREGHEETIRIEPPQ